MFICVYVCVCVCARAQAQERGRQTDREREFTYLSMDTYEDSDVEEEEDILDASIDSRVLFRGKIKIHCCKYIIYRSCQLGKITRKQSSNTSLLRTSITTNTPSLNV